MKPKYHSITRILPTVVSIALSLPFTTQATIYVDDTAGDATPTAADNGATTIRADGGTSLTPMVITDATINMSGDLLETEVLEITAPNYTVTNLGILSGSNHNGIFADQAFTLVNSGTIAGGAAPNSWRGVLTTNATITNNSTGIITGTDDGIHFTADGGSITNSGTISGTEGGTSDGIRGRNDLEVYNQTGGSITGVQHGIMADGNVYVENESGASITSTGGDAIHLTADGGTIDNTGTISGDIGINSDGIRGRNGLTVNNYNDILSTGGSISGVQFGILADNDLIVMNEEFATIEGDISGINAGDNATITNDGTIDGIASQGISVGNTATILNDGDITGGISGIVALDNANITNYQDATIDGTIGDGITAGNFTNIVNDGTITGSLNGVTLTDATSSTVTNMVNGLISGTLGIVGDIGAETINNNGTITGVTTAIELNGGANIINLDNGSVINGDVRATGGTNAITMTGGLTSTTDTTENTIDGSVFDAVTLNKSGSGLAVVTGTTAADTIAVTGGYLYLRDNVTNVLGGENVITANSAEIGGLGVWDSAITLTNGASISGGSNPVELTNTVADSIGILTVTGDVSLDSSSDYIWNVTPPGVTPMHDQIVLTGAGNVFTTTNSNFVIAPTQVNAPLVDGNRLVVLTDETLVGNFDNISVATFSNTTPDNGPYVANQNNPIISEYFSTLTKVNADTDWQLSIVHDYGQFGSTPNEVAAGALLDGLVNTATGDVADLLAAMDYSDQSYTQAVLASLDPGSYMVTAAGLANNNFQMHRRVERHNAAVRAGGAQGMQEATTTTYSDSSAKGGVATTTTSSSTMDSGCSGATNVWGSFSYDWQEMHSSNSLFDQDGETASFTAGMDFTVAENFRLGILAEGAQTDWSGDDAFGSDVESYRFAVYANWGAATGWFVDALVGYNMHNVDQNRFASDSSSFDADGWQGLVNIGYAIDTGSGTFSPFIGIEWQQLSMDEFDTDGPIPLSIDGYDIESLRALAGVRWEQKFSSTMTGYASAAYAFELEDGAATTTVGFGGGSYTAAGLEQGDAVLVSAGLRWTMGSCTTIDIGYSGEFAMDDGVDSNGANIGVNFSF